MDELKKMDTLISKACKHLLENSYSPTTITSYSVQWRNIRRYMIFNQIKIYNKKVEDEFIINKFGKKPLHEYSRREREYHRSIKKLLEFKESGQIKYKTLRVKGVINFDFSGPIGEEIQSFIEFYKSDRYPARTTVYKHKRNLLTFLEYCKQNKLESVQHLDLAFILIFLKSLKPKPSNEAMIWSIRSFTKYLYNQQNISINIAKRIPKYKVVKQPKIPSTYSAEEIEKLLASVERQSTYGKRNYAVILIAARLGLRASDIRNLKFENLDWVTNKIVLDQFKTGKTIELPLFSDVGNAIIDYIKFGRPKSKEPYVFLKEKKPYGQFINSNMVTYIVQKALKKSGINIAGRNCGAHALRHSLASRLLEQHTILPVISEVLGHSNTESTRYYLRIGLNSMKACIMDVPPVKKEFYMHYNVFQYEI
ncbi:MAG: site-specific integrase [Cytophaga sp.]|uniref:site-specific integrase n=1 Tax=Cytophaga sp. TaxID=29535 RepID=UPI003F80DE94